MKSFCSFLFARVSSFRYAFQGLLTLAKRERNFWVHLLAATIVISLALCLGCSDLEWLWLMAAIFSVLTAEAFNTAIERLADRVTKEQDPIIGEVKDLAAAGVLLAAIFAFIVGVIIFVPHFY